MSGWGAVEFVGAHIEHRCNRLLDTWQLAGVASFSEPAENIGGWFFAAVGANYSERSLANRCRYWRPVEDLRIVISVTPCIRPGGARFYESVDHLIIVCGCL